MKKLKFFCLIFIILITCFIFTGCEEKNEEELLKNKNLSELEYLENITLTTIKNYLTGTYYNDNNQIDWSLVKNNFLKLANSTNIILVDLTSLSIDGDKILELENRVNEVISSIDGQDENSFFASMSNLYNLMSVYLSEYYNDNNLIKTKIIKSNFLKGLYYSNVGDWENAKLCIDAIENDYNELTKNQEYINENFYRINKNYVIIQEFKMAIETEKKENVQIKYLESLEMF